MEAFRYYGMRFPAVVPGPSVGHRCSTGIVSVIFSAHKSSTSYLLHIALHFTKSMFNVVIIRCQCCAIHDFDGIAAVCCSVLGVGKCKVLVVQ